MGKKQVAVSLRKPPPVDPNAFVTGTEPPAPHAPIALHSVEGPILATRSGERRELTIYLPQDLARELAIRCVELDRDVSNLVAEAVTKVLAVDEPVPVKVELPADRWTRVRAIVHELRARIPMRLGIAGL